MLLSDSMTGEIIRLILYLLSCILHVTNKSVMHVDFGVRTTKGTSSYREGKIERK